MHRWRLSISARCNLRLDAARRVPGPMAALAAAAAALAATLLLGLTGAPTPLFRGAPFEIAGLPAVAGFGLLAWHFARLTALPLAGPAPAALIAALAPALLLPGLGAGALAVPAAIALLMLWTDASRRVVALLVQCGALAAAAEPPGGNFHNGFVYATMLGAALFLAARSLSGAANDNPSMEREGQISPLPPASCYASGDSQSGSGEYGSFQ